MIPQLPIANYWRRLISLSIIFLLSIGLLNLIFWTNPVTWIVYAAMSLWISIYTSRMLHQPTVLDVYRDAKDRYQKLRHQYRVSGNDKIKSRVRNMENFLETMKKYL